MRCPDCNKFVSMENGDLEVNDVSGNYSGDILDISYSMRGVRVCADCGTELKSLDMDGNLDVDIRDMEGYKALAPEQQAGLLAALDSGDAEIEVSEGDSDVSESGGGRYKKNMIVSKLVADVEVVWGEVKFSQSYDLVEEHAASEYEECC